MDKPRGKFFPIEKVAPEDPTFVVVARNLTQLVETLRTGVEPWRVVDRALTTARLDDELRGGLGFNPLDLNDLDDAGLDLDGPVVLFSSGFEPTLAVRIKDPKRLEGFLKQRTAKVTTYVKSHRGHELTSWKLGRRQRGTFVTIDDVFLLHVAMRSPSLSSQLLGAASRPALLPSRVGMPTSRPTAPTKWKWSLGWLDQILDRRLNKRPSLANSSALSWLQRAVKESSDVVAYLRLAALNRAARNKVERLLIGGACKSIDADLMALERVGLGLKLERRSVRARLAVGLAGDSAARLRQAVASPLTLPAKLWQEAALRLRLSLPPRYVKKVVEPPPSPRCGPVAHLLREARWVFAAYLRSPWLRSSAGRLAGALLAADERGKSTLHLKGALAAELGTANAERFFRSQLTLKPASGKPLRIEDRAVEQVIPGLTIAEAVQACFADKRLRLSVGDGMMARVLAEGAEAPAGEVVALRLEPGSVADLRAPLKLIEPGAPKGPAARWRRARRRRKGYGVLDKLAHLASSYKRIELRVALEGDVLGAVAEYELR